MTAAVEIHSYLLRGKEYVHQNARDIFWYMCKKGHRVYCSSRNDGMRENYSFLEKYFRKGERISINKKFCFDVFQFFTIAVSLLNLEFFNRTAGAVKEKRCVWHIHCYVNGVGAWTSIRYSLLFKKSTATLVSWSRKKVPHVCLFYLSLPLIIPFIILEIRQLSIR